MSNTPISPPKLNCPTCQQGIVWSEDYPHRPFCSHRCQLIDLGEWASESYSIPEAVQDGTLNGSDTDWG